MFRKIGHMKSEQAELEKQLHECKKVFIHIVLQCFSRTKRTLFPLLLALISPTDKNMDAWFIAMND